MTTHFDFTKPNLQALREPKQGERIVYHDTHKNAGGLQLRHTRTTKAFFVQKRVDGKPERVTIGKFPDMSIENARKEAAREFFDCSEDQPQQRRQSLKDRDHAARAVRRVLEAPAQ